MCTLHGGPPPRACPPPPPPAHGAYTSGAPRCRGGSPELWRWGPPPLLSPPPPAPMCSPSAAHRAGGRGGGRSYGSLFRETPPIPLLSGHSGGRGSAWDRRGDRTPKRIEVTFVGSPHQLGGGHVVTRPRSDGSKRHNGVPEPGAPLPLPHNPHGAPRPCPIAAPQTRSPRVQSTPKDAAPPSSPCAGAPHGPRSPPPPPRELRYLSPRRHDGVPSWSPVGWTRLCKSVGGGALCHRRPHGVCGGRVLLSGTQGGADVKREPGLCRAVACPLNQHACPLNQHALRPAADVWGAGITEWHTGRGRHQTGTGSLPGAGGVSAQPTRPTSRRGCVGGAGITEWHTGRGRRQTGTGSLPGAGGVSAQPTRPTSCRGCVGGGYS